MVSLNSDNTLVIIETEEEKALYNGQKLTKEEREALDVETIT